MIVSNKLLNEQSTKKEPNLIKLKVYYLTSYVLSIVMFVIFTKTMSSLTDVLSKIQVNLVIITTSFLFIVSLFLIIQILISTKFNSFQFKLIEYFKNIPLTFVSYFYLTRIYYIKINNYNFYFLLLTTVYFSLQSIINIVLIESYNKNFKNLIFKFLFRYFFFISKSMSLILYLSTYNDNFSSPKSSYKVFISSFTFIFLSFTLSCTWYFVKTKLNFFQLFFESCVFLVDYNDKFFKCNLSKSLNKISLDIKLSKIQTVIYFLVNFISILTSSYFWFFNSIEVYQQIQEKTMVLSLLIEEKNKLTILNLIDLEEKISIRQFELVIVFGSLTIAMLAYYIHYSYYEIEQKDGIDTNFLNRKSLMEQARKSIGNCPKVIPSIVDSLNDCSSLSTLTNSSTDEKIDFMNDTRYDITNLNRQKSFSLQFSSFEYEDRLIFAYDTSSSVISSDTSISSIYQELSNYYKFSEAGTFWQSEKTINRSTITTNSLTKHNKKFSNSIEGTINSKVMEWIKKANIEENEINLTPKFHSTNLDFIL